MKRVLFILHLPPPSHGASLVGNLIKTSTQINSVFSTRYINLSTSVTIEDIGRTSVRKGIKYCALILKVINGILVFKPDLCYITPSAKGFGFYKDVIIIAIIKFFRVKRIFHYHNKGIAERHNRLPDNLLYKFSFRNTSVILLSRHLYQEVKKYVPESHVFYCPNGITDLSKDLHKPSFKNSGSPVEVLFLSHLIRSKGMLVLIEACAILKARDTNFHCTIAGGDAEMKQKEVEEIVRLKELTDLISLAGPVYGERKVALMKSADILAHPSFNDCYPLVLLEAMSLSLPIISTFEGAIPEIVDNGTTGFLVTPKDPESLADKLEVLINDPELRKDMGDAARIKYENEFTLGIFENRLTEILELQ